MDPPPPAAGFSGRQMADALTLLRGVLGLPLLLALHQGWFSLAWVLLLSGGFSDALDGWLARRSGGGSVFGARMDPLTDKVLVCAPLLWLASKGTLPLVAIWLLLARELLVSGWRSQQSSGGPASAAGKGKTILQFVALLLLLWPPSWPWASMAWASGWWLFWPGFLLALTSAVAYLRAP